MTTESALATISGDIYQPAVRESFGCVLSDKSINFEREAGFAIQCLGANDYAMKVAMSNRQSVVDAVVNVAAIGISLNPAEKLAYLVPRKNKICLDISYIGLMKLAMSTGAVRWAQAALVYLGDTFALNGYDKPPTHTFNPFATDRGPLVGVYCVVKTSDGDYLTHPMAIADVYDIRDRSEAWSRHKDGKHVPSGPWLTDEAEMVKKTCVKQGCKYWPKVERLDRAIHSLNTEAGEGLEVLAQAPKLSLPPPTLNDQIEHATGPTCAPERLPILEAVRNNIVDLFNADDIVGAFEECETIEDGDEKTYLWTVLLKPHSKIRTAIRKHGESLKTAA